MKKIVRRILMVLTLALVVVAMLVDSAMPVVAQGRGKPEQLPPPRPGASDQGLIIAHERSSGHAPAPSCGPAC